MGEKTETYDRGMRAVNNFYNMLFAAMHASMNDGELRISPNGAYGWRGYQINHYHNLASGQYYCQVYLGDPDKFARNDGSINAYTPRELVFKEGYKDPHHKPGDNREEKHQIKAGEYYYPFKVSLDLYRSRFFLLSKNEQFEMLKSFFAFAAQSALIWQNSEARGLVTSSPFLNPINKNAKTAKSETYGKVDIEFLDAWKIQNALFERFKGVLCDVAPKRTGKPIKWIRQNANHHNFDFRGFRLKFDDLLPGDSCDFLWAIYFKEPAYKFLRCYSTEKRIIGKPYNLVEAEIFDMDESRQNKELEIFILDCLQA